MYIGRSSFFVCDDYYIYWVVCRSGEGYVEIALQLFVEWEEFEFVGIEMNKCSYVGLGEYRRCSPW